MESQISKKSLFFWWTERNKDKLNHLYGMLESNGYYVRRESELGRRRYLNCVVTVGLSLLPSSTIKLSYEESFYNRIHETEELIENRNLFSHSPEGWEVQGASC
jgi:hypothetical protein